MEKPVFEKNYANRFLSTPGVRSWLLFDQASGRVAGFVAFIHRSPFAWWSQRGNTQAPGRLRDSFFNQCPELLFAVHPEFRGRGYAVEGIRHLCDALLESGEAEGVGAWVASGNEPSLRVLRKVGMAEAAHHPKHDYRFFLLRNPGRRRSLASRVAAKVDWSRPHTGAFALLASLVGWYLGLGL